MKMLIQQGKKYKHVHCLDMYIYIAERPELTRKGWVCSVLYFSGNNRLLWETPDEVVLTWRQIGNWREIN